MNPVGGTSWLVPAATIVVAVITFGGVLVNALVRRRKPVETTDLWEENRKRRAEYDELRKEFDEYRDNKDKEFADFKKENDQALAEFGRERRALQHLVDIIGDGFDAAWTYIRVLSTALTECGIAVPEPSPYVKVATQAAREIRNAPHIGEQTT